MARNIILGGLCGTCFGLGMAFLIFPWNFENMTRDNYCSVLMGIFCFTLVGMGIAMMYSEKGEK